MSPEETSVLLWNSEYARQIPAEWKIRKKNQLNIRILRQYKMDIV